MDTDKRKGAPKEILDAILALMDVAERQPRTRRELREIAEALANWWVGNDQTAPL